MRLLMGSFPHGDAILRLFLHQAPCCCLPSVGLSGLRFALLAVISYAPDVPQNRNRQPPGTLHRGALAWAICGSVLPGLALLPHLKVFEGCI